jgi:hypothetical protein
MRSSKDFYHPKRARFIAKQVVFREKVHVFLCGFRKGRTIVRFSLRKMRYFERKTLLLPLIKHNLSFFPAALRRPYSANFAGFALCIGANDL